MKNNKILKNPKGIESIEEKEKRLNYNYFSYIMTHSLRRYYLSNYKEDLSKLKRCLLENDNYIFFKHLFIFRNNIIDLNVNTIITNFMYYLNLDNSIFDKYKIYKDKKDLDLDEFKRWVIKYDLKLILDIMRF